MTSTHRTGLVVIPPRDAWAPIQAIRAEHDRKVLRWMPHITLVYPFVPLERFDEAAGRLAPALGSIGRFEVGLNRFETFVHPRDRYTVWLRPEPEEPLVALQAAAWSASWDGPPPRPPWRRFRPHLSVGQAEGRPAMLRLLENLRKSWPGLKFPVDRVAMIARDDLPDDTFRVVRELPLG